MGKWLLSLFHQHEFEKTGFKERIGYAQDGQPIRYSVRIYTCKHCGKRIFIDGRNDKKARVIKGEMNDE